MNSTLKRLIPLLLACFLLFLAGCGNTGNTDVQTPEPAQQSTPEPQQNLTNLGKFISVIPDRGAGYQTTAEGNEVAKQAIIQAIAKDRGVALDMEVIVLNQDNFYNELNTLITSGTPIDSITVDYSMFSTFAGLGNCVPLDDKLQNQGQNLLNTVDMGRWEQVMYGNQIYGIPGASLPEETFLVTRGDMRLYTGLESIQTREEFEAASYAYKAMGFTPICLTWDQILDTLAYSFAIPHGEYILDPAKKNNVFMREQVFYYYREFLPTIRKWYEDGLLHPDVFTATESQMRDEFISGKGMIYAAEYKNIEADIAQLKQSVPTAQYELVIAPTGRRMPEPKLTGEMAVDSVLMLFVTGQNHDALMTYKDWSYSDKVNYTMTNLGVFGTHINYNNAASEFEYIGDYSSANIPYNGMYTLGISTNGIFSPVLEKVDASNPASNSALIRQVYDYLSTSEIKYEPTVQMAEEAANYMASYRATIDEGIKRYVTGEITWEKYEEYYSKCYVWSKTIIADIKPRLFVVHGISEQ